MPGQTRADTAHFPRNSGARHRERAGGRQAGRAVRPVPSPRGSALGRRGARGLGPRGGCCSTTTEGALSHLLPPRAGAAGSQLRLDAHEAVQLHQLEAVAWQSGAGGGGGERSIALGSAGSSAHHGPAQTRFPGRPHLVCEVHVLPQQRRLDGLQLAVGRPRQVRPGGRLERRLAGWRLVWRRERGRESALGRARASRLPLRPGPGPASRQFAKGRRTSGGQQPPSLKRRRAPCRSGSPGCSRTGPCAAWACLKAPCALAPSQRSPGWPVRTPASPDQSRVSPATVVCTPGRVCAARAPSRAAKCCHVSPARGCPSPNRISQGPPLTSSCLAAHQDGAAVPVAGAG